jgi:hypothetical protein
MIFTRYNELLRGPVKRPEGQAHKCGEHEHNREAVVQERPEAAVAFGD